LGWPNSLIAHFEAELRAHFSEAWIGNYESLIPRMKNDEKDRHVLAAAVQCGAPLIVIFHLRHFRPEHLRSWGLAALHPQSFPIGMFRQEQGVVMMKLGQQAADRGRSLREFLDILNAARLRCGASAHSGALGRRDQGVRTRLCGSRAMA